MTPNKTPLTKHPWYSEGMWAGKRMIPMIEHTTYGSIDNAIKVKSTLTEQFETEFGFSRDGDYNRDYAYNLGILDALIEHYGRTQRPTD